MSDTCTIEFDGHSGEWIIPCDMIQYVNDEGINISSNNLTLYQQYRDYSGYNTTYPFLSLRSCSYPVYYTSNNNYTVWKDIHSITVSDNSHVFRESYLFMPSILFCCTMILLFSIFKR